MLPAYQCIMVLKSAELLLTTIEMTLCLIVSFAVPMAHGGGVMRSIGCRQFVAFQVASCDSYNPYDSYNIGWLLVPLAYFDTL